jgi:hypothetical protein
MLFPGFVRLAGKRLGPLVSSCDDVNRIEFITFYTEAAAELVNNSQTEMMSKCEWSFVMPLKYLHYKLGADAEVAMSLSSKCIEPGG